MATQHTNLSVLKYDIQSQSEFTTYAVDGNYNSLKNHFPNLVMGQSETNEVEWSLINTQTGEVLFIGSYNNTLQFWAGIHFYYQK